MLGPSPTAPQVVRPGSAETLEAETDARVGGRFHVLMRTADGELHGVSGIYREVVPD